jgi:hypothetical protein
LQRRLEGPGQRPHDGTVRPHEAQRRCP